MTTDNLTPEDKMKTLKAGDKAVYLKEVGHGNFERIIVTIKEITSRHVIYYDETGSLFQRNTTTPSFCFQPVYIVRVLQDGTAKQVNPMGDEPDINDYDVRVPEGEERYYDNWNEWHAAEAQRLTLPCVYNPQPLTVDAVHATNAVGATWYALLSSDKFQLLKPKTD